MSRIGWGKGMTKRLRHNIVILGSPESGISVLKSCLGLVSGLKIAGETSSTADLRTINRSLLQGLGLTVPQTHDTAAYGL